MVVLPNGNKDLSCPDSERIRAQVASVLDPRKLISDDQPRRDHALFLGNLPAPRFESTAISSCQGPNRGNDNRHVRQTTRHVKGAIPALSTRTRATNSGEPSGFPANAISEGMWVMIPVIRFTKCWSVLGRMLWHGVWLSLRLISPRLGYFQRF